MNPLLRSLFTFARSVALATLVLSLPLSAATWYVATNGSDVAAGTQAAPFASITRAQTAAAAGDTVFIRGGTYTTFTIFATDANYNYVHRLNKSGVNWSAFPGETPTFDFSSVPTNLRVCGFHVTGANLTITGFVVTGVKDGTQKQSECFRIDGSAASVDFYDCVARDNAANGFYFTNRARGSCNRCDAYNNIGTNSESIGNTDGFGAHGSGVAFRYCRAWNNSDDGYDCISSDGSNTFDHCWAYNMRAGGDSNGFKVGGYGSGAVPGTVPAHTVIYCLSANNNAHGFYANHQPAKAADWLHNTAYNHSNGNFDMLERVSSADATDIPGTREVLHFNLSFTGTLIKDDNNPPAAVTNNSWNTPGLTVTTADFLSVDATQMIAPRSAGNNMPFITFMHLAPGSDLGGLGAFEPAPAAPANVTASWVNSGRVDVAWTASPGATEYYVRRATAPGGPYANVGIRVAGTSFSDTTAGGGGTWFYQVYAMNNISYDAGFSAEVVATMPSVAITSIALDTGRSSSDGITNDQTLVFTGIAGPGSAVAVTRVGVGVIGNTFANASGGWSFDYTGTALPAGTHAFQVTATDPGTGTSFTSNAFNLTVDLTAPAAPVIASVSTAPGALVISGTAEPFGDVAVTLDGATFAGATLAAANGAWSVTYAGAVSADLHAFTATLADIAGNPSLASAAFVIDTRVTTPAILAAQTDFGLIASGDLTRDRTISLTGTAGAGDTVTLTRAGAGAIGGTFADGSGNWSFDYTAVTLPDGGHSFSAAGSNGNGTSPSSPAFTLTVDSVAPAVASIVRFNPTTATVTSAAASLVYRVTFTEPVSGVDSGDFTLTTTGGASGVVAGVSSGGGTIVDVTVNTLAGAGTLRLDLKAAGTGVVDGAGNAAPGFATGEIYTRVISSNGNGTWIQATSGGLWSEPSNWLNAVIPSANTHSANFNTLDLVAINIVQLDSPRTINSATFGDTNAVTPGSWFLDNNGLPANTLTLAGTTPTITVNALGTDATATIGARLAGTGGLIKGGAGTLVLAGANPLSGILNVTVGTLRVGAGGGAAHSTVTVGTGATLDVNGGTLSATGATALGGTSTVVVNDGAATFAAVNFGTADGGTFRINGGTVTAASVGIPRSTDATIRYTTGFVVDGGVMTVTGAVNLGTGNSNGVMSVEDGALTVNGIITVGNQATATRGGAMRVIGGTFTSTNTASGIVLSRTNGTNANNVSFATFSGGVSTVEKFTLGFDATVTAGSATLTVDGGELYLGSGGIVKNGAAGMAANVNLSGGTVGAKANWATALPLTLPAGGNVTFKAASAANAPFNIALNGLIGGAGGLTKTGGGTLTIDGAGTHTYAGTTIVQAGALRLTSTLAAAANGVVINGGALTGNGIINRPITLNAGGAIAPDGAAAVATLTGTSLTWHGGGALAFDLGATADRLVLGGALTRGDPGAYLFNFAPGAGYAIGNVYTLASFASTSFAASDFSLAGLPAGTTGIFSIDGNELHLTIVGPPAINSAATAGGTFGAPFTYAITATNFPASFDATGLPPGLTVDPVSGVISGTPGAAGSFNITLLATNAAGTGTGSLTLSIAQAVAGVALSNLGATYDGHPHAAGVSTTPPGLGVIVTYDGSTTPPTNADSYTVIATVNDANYTGATSGTLIIAKASQTIAFPNPGAKTFGDAPFALHATATSALGVSYAVVSGPAAVSAGTVTLTGAGSVTLRASQGGNSNYNAAADVDVTFAVAKNSTTIVAVTDLAATYDGNPHAVTVATTPANLAVNVTYAGSATAPTNAGTYEVVATIDDANYAGSSTVSLVIAKAGQTIAFPNPGAKTFGDAPFALHATATSDLGVGYTVVSGPATVSGGTVTLTGAGSVTLRASQGGNGNFNAAPDVDVTFDVAKNATATVAITDLVAAYDGTPQPVTVTTTPAGLTVNVTYGGATAVPTLPGTYAVVATIDDTNYSGSGTASLTITITALVRHAPSLNGDLDGSLQVLLGENLTLNGDALVSGDLLVPGTPTVRLNGHPTLVGTVDATGSTSPSNYTVTLNGNAMARYLVRRVTPIAMPVVSAPQASTGTRDVSLNSSGQSAGDFSTIRDLTLNGNVGSIAVPPGKYRNLTANGNGGFILGVAGATTPSVYHLQRLTLNGNATLQVVGPVILRIANDVSINNGAGQLGQPEQLTFELATGGLTLNGNASVHALVLAPNGSVTVNGNAALHGRVAADRLTLNGNGLLEEVP